MVIPGKINFTQMGRYGRHCEQCYRQNFGRLRSKSLNWLRFNAALALRYFGTEGRKAIAIDPSYISKAGKKTLAVIKRYRKELLKLTGLIVADAFFSTRTFYEGIRAQGFHLISRFRDNAVLYYLYQGGPTGKRGRSRTKDGKIDFKNLDMSKMTPVTVDGLPGKAYTLLAYSKALKCMVRLVIWIMRICHAPAMITKSIAVRELLTTASRCLEFGSISTILKYILMILAAPQPLKTSFHGTRLAQNLALCSICTNFCCKFAQCSDH